MTKGVNRTLKQMIAAYVEDNHKKLDQYLPELRFAINSAVQETIGMSPAELHLGRKLQGPMDKILHGQNLSPDAASYDIVEHLSQLQSRAKACCRKYIYIYIYTFSRRFYPKRLTVHSGYTFFVRYHFLVFFVKYQERQLRSYSKKRRESSFKEKINFP